MPNKSVDLTSIFVVTLLLRINLCRQVICCYSFAEKQSFVYVFGIWILNFHQDSSIITLDKFFLVKSFFKIIIAFA